MAGIAVPAVALLLQVDAPAPAPLALVGGPILAVGLMGTAMIAAAIGGRLWAGALLALLTGVGLIYLAKALGMPPLPHPFSTGLAVIVTSFGFAAMGKFLARVSSARAWMTAAGLTAGQALVLLIAAAAPGLFPDWLLALVPAQWASVSIQTALTGTGTRAASSALITLSGSAVVLLLAAWLRRRPGWCVPVLLAAWIALAALVWTRPAPPMPRADLAIVAAPAGPVAPIADVPPNPATASAIDRVRRQIDKWSAAAETDPAQRARNLLLIAAVPDLYDTEPLQSHLPVLVAAELEARLPAGQRAAILAAIAADPAAGSVAARETLPELGLPANVGDEAPVRNRMALYAARLNR
ncbi:hypothetical protein GRI99_14430 [Altererythrobacter buctensis]|uniref:Uncharacterized protein n=1 Tax=Alteraurantiacibacter buctensis TaxID=1503981 RepID=A0A844Z0N9_9SPHN|nr:hypothetical protein [Alteraurantiacibacter buctensis]